MTILELHDLTKLIDPENKMTQKHHMNQIEIQARLKYPKIKTTTQFTIESYTKLQIRCSQAQIEQFYRFKCLE